MIFRRRKGRRAYKWNVKVEMVAEDVVDERPYFGPGGRELFF